MARPMTPVSSLSPFGCRTRVTPANTALPALTLIQSKSKATPSQVRSEVWMSLIHGSMGLIYFVHESQPKFDEAALLHDPEMLRAVTAINRQITELAPVLDSPTVSDAPCSPGFVIGPAGSGCGDVEAAGGGPLSLRGGDASGDTTATFTYKGLAGDKTVEALGEDRSLSARDGAFSDTFISWAAHGYRLK